MELILLILFTYGLIQKFQINDLLLLKLCLAQGISGDRYKS